MRFSVEIILGPKSSKNQCTSAAATKCSVLRSGQGRMMVRSSIARSTSFSVAYGKRRPIVQSVPR